MTLGGKPKPFDDGQGLCSPGRWPPEHRVADKSGMASKLKVALLKTLQEKISMKHTLLQLACNKVTTCPFGVDLIRSGKAVVIEQLMAHGATDTVKDTPTGQPYMLMAIGEGLRIMGDPDFKICHLSRFSFMKGVRIGFKRKLHRTPAIFPRKDHWRGYEDAEQELDRKNYKPTIGLEAQLLHHFGREKEMGRVDFLNLKENEARIKYPGDTLRIASLLAETKDSGGMRVLHDATHGVEVNPHIKVLDQHGTPSIAENQQYLEEQGR